MLEAADFAKIRNKISSELNDREALELIGDYADDVKAELHDLKLLMTDKPPSYLQGANPAIILDVCDNLIDLVIGLAQRDNERLRAGLAALAPYACDTDGKTAAQTA
jgi:hypothetical protein